MNTSESSAGLGASWPLIFGPSSGRVQVYICPDSTGQHWEWVDRILYHVMLVSSWKHFRRKLLYLPGRNISYCISYANHNYQV